MKVISVVNIKGGSGKTTVATNIAATAASRGMDVLLIDADSKVQQSSMSFRQLREQKIAEIEDYNKMVVEENANAPKNSFMKKEKPQLNRITAMSNASTSIHLDVRKYSNFDLVVVDAGAGDNAVVRSAISAAAGDGILLIPCLPSPYDIMATQDTCSMVKEARTYIPLDNVVLLLNQVFPNSNAKILGDVFESLEDMKQEYQIGIMDTQLTSYMVYRQSVMSGMSVTEYDPKSKAAVEMNALLDEILATLEK